jgi:hypothetical protein
VKRSANPNIERMINVFDLHFSAFVCGKQSRENQHNGASHFKEKCLRKAQHYQSSLKEEKALCKLNSLTLPPKNHNLFREIGSKRGMGEKGESVTTSS